jgi:hypothetical protein
MSYPKIIKEAALEKMFHTDLSFTDIIKPIYFLPSKNKIKY